MLRGRTLQVLHVGAIGVVAVVAAVGVLFADQVPLLASVAGPLGYGLGKLFGKPLMGVVEAVVASLKHDEKVRITELALRSMPPEKAQAVIAASLAPPSDAAYDRQATKPVQFVFDRRKK